MTMNRREAIQNMLLIMSGTALVPAYLRGEGSPSIKLAHLDIDGDQEQLLGEIAETIITATDTPGAKELGLHLFVMKMVDDCCTQEEQRSFEIGLSQLESISQETFGGSFADGTEEQREALFERINLRSEHTEELKTFCRIMKQRTIQGYKVSEYVMTELIPHKMIPDPYDGYYPASKLGGEI